MKKNKIIIGIISFIILIIAGILCISYIVSKSLSMPERDRVRSNPMKKIGLKYEEIEFNSCGNKIKGWYIPSEKNRFTVVYSHGYQGNRESSGLTSYDMMEHVNKMGGNFLAFDFSGEGESEGRVVTVGYREQNDLKEAISFVKKKSRAPIFLYGISMGAATTTCVAGTNPRGVSGSIVDSPFSNLKDYLSTNLSKWSNLPDFPFKPIILSMEENIAGVKLESVNPKGSVSNMNIPMLLIHGRGDPTIPYSESVKIYNNNKSKIKLKIINNNGHCKSLKENRQEYLSLFTDFINSNIGVR